MTPHTRRLTVAAAIAASLVLAACGNGDDADGSGGNGAGADGALRVGALFPQSGDLAFGAADALEGVEIAVELYVEDGGEAELFTADAPDPAAGVSGARQLITNDNVDVIIGTYASAVATAAAPAAASLDTLYVETTAFAESLTVDATNVLRTTITSGFLGSYAAEFASTGLAEQLGTSPEEMRVGLLYTDDEFGTSIATAAQAAVEDSPAELVFETSYPGDISDFSSALLQLDEADVDVLFHVAQVADGVLFWRQAQELDINLPAVVGAGGGYGQSQFADPLGDNANGLFNIVPPTSRSIDTTALTDEAQELLERLDTKLEERGSTAGPYTDWAFMGTWVFLNDIAANAESFTIEGFRDAAAGVSIASEDSITGFGFEFAGEGEEHVGQNLRAEPVVQQWQDGELQVVYPDDFAVTDMINVPLPDWAQRGEEIADSDA